MDSREHRYFVLGIGSNVSDRCNIIKHALDHLSSLFKFVCQSDIYSTPAINGKDDDYSNCVAVYEINGASEQEINLMLKDIEVKYGRNSNDSLAGTIALDLDLVVYDGRVLRPKDFNREYFIKGWNQINYLLKLV